MDYIYSMFRELVISNVYVFWLANLYDTQASVISHSHGMSRVKISIAIVVKLAF